MTALRIIKNLPREWMLSVLLFSLFFAWVLAFPFGGILIKKLVIGKQINLMALILGGFFSVFTGLLVTHLWIKNIRQARIAILFSLTVCLLMSFLYFSSNHILWFHALYISGIFAGCFASSYGFFFRALFSRQLRFKAAADMLILSSILGCILALLSHLLSPYTALILSGIYLFLAFMLAFRLPTEEHSPIVPSARITLHSYLTKPLLLLCLFVIVITINSGLIIKLTAQHYPIPEWFRYCFHVFTYCVTLFLLRITPRKLNFVYILYIISAFTGLSYITFLIFGSSIEGFIISNIFLPSAMALLNLFWASVVAELLDYEANAGKIMGIALSVSVLGIFTGDILGIMLHYWGVPGRITALYAMGILFIIFIFLPLLNKPISIIQQIHEKTVDTATELTQKQTIIEFLQDGNLTERELETATLLLLGYTYKMIASELHVSENTIRSHIKKIYLKYDVQSRMELLNIMLKTNESGGRPQNNHI